jgi:hypothetical protein
VAGAVGLGLKPARIIFTARAHASRHCEWSEAIQSEEKPNIHLNLDNLK